MSAAAPERVAIVTGAGRGLGAAIAGRLAESGYAVVVCDIDGAGAQRTAAQLGESGHTALGVRTDVTDALSVAALTEATLARYGRIDALVNAAGAFRPPVSTVDLAEDVWDLVVDSNLKGSFLTIRAVLPAMLGAGSGAIVNIASNAARSTATALGAEYTAAKAGVLGLTRHVAREVAGRGIRVNVVAPGPIDGERLAHLGDTEERQAIAATIPVGRLAAPTDVAEVVEFLLSDRARFMVGATVDVNGGIVMV
ncbi:3-oxoacyl-[acyl-carrier-protein] reductase [Microbacterium sediminicola]|uniref:3-oxoacyl-[acyl-carrier-protein] reductase n=1 Tax=Microbacterium sediminicola TaxID=415210 RepID=A0ABP4UI30_9MICO